VENDKGYVLQGVGHPREGRGRGGEDHLWDICRIYVDISVRSICGYTYGICVRSIYGIYVESVYEMCVGLVVGAYL